MSRLKEVLERRLFRDNGMLGPENPQGILNSSNELADVVRMQNGGFNTLRSTINMDNPRGIPVGNMPQYRPGEMGNIYEAPPVPPPIPGITTAVQRRSFETPFGAQKISDFVNETPGERTNRYFRETEPEYEPVLDRDEPTRAERLAKGMAAIPGALARNIMTGGEELAQGIVNLDEDLSDYFFSSDLGGTIPLELGATINEMQRSQPEFAAEIDSYAVLIIDEQRRDSGTDPSPDELKQQVADMLYRTVEQPSIPTTVAERIEAERMALRPTESELQGPDGDIPTILIDRGTPESEIEDQPTVVEDQPTVVEDQAEGPREGPREDGVPRSAEEKDQGPPTPPVTQETVNRLFKSGPAADPLDKKETMLSVLRKRLDESRGEKVDKAALKEEIDALLPAIQNDPVSEGLMAMMVGAKIAEKGVAAGLSESLPQAMEFFNNQRAQKQAREREVAAAALTEGFSREKEQRTNQQALLLADYTSELEMQTFMREKQFENFLDTDRYVVINNSVHNVDGEDIKVPFGTPLSLNSDQVNQIGGLGVQIVRVEDFGDDDVLKYLKADPTMTADGMLAQMSPQDKNRLYTEPTAITAFEKYGSPYKMFVMHPKPALLLDKGLREILGDYDRIGEGQLLGLHQGYKNAIFEAKKLYGDLSGLKDLATLTPAEGGGAMSGWKRFQNEIYQASRASKIPGIEQWADDLIRGTGRDITQLSEFQVRARHVLAKIAPILLGESGKTISDADRALVAQALGFQVTYPEGKMTLTAPTESYFKDESVVVEALEVTMESIARNIDQATGEYMSHLERFGLRPSAAAEYSRAPTEQEREEASALFADLTT